MGGDYGGADCVHVIDVRGDGEATEALELRQGYVMRSDTDVVIYDEHGNVCQFTYQEWESFVGKVLRGDFDHIGLDAYGDGYVPIKIDLSGVDPNATGVDPSAMARLDALPSVSVDISGTFDTVEPGEKTVVLGTFIPHTAEATGTPEHLRAVADELERRDRSGVRSDPFSQPPGRTPSRAEGEAQLREWGIL